MARGLEIVHADFSSAWRGGQQQLLFLVRELRRLGCRQTIVAPSGAVSRRLAEEGFTLVLPGREARRRAAAAGVVHVHDGHAHTWLLRATSRRGARRVLSRRVAYPIRGVLSRWKYRQLDLVIAVSRYVQAQVLATGMAAGRIRVIHDCLELDGLPEAAQTAEARARARRQCRLQDEALYAVCLGAFTAEKGVSDAIAALAQLPPPWRLILPGSGPLRAALEQQCARLGCAARVRFTGGEAAAAQDWVAAADVLLMPSREEGFGSAGLLAMALGCPVVASRVGGIPELVEHEASGLLIPAADPPALAAACRRLAAEPQLREKLVRAGLERVQHYRSRETAAATLAAYEAACAS
ncbi:MAG: glycosyltransferase family 4 protein [Terriglobales bacterium]